MLRSSGRALQLVARRGQISSFTETLGASTGWIAQQNRSVGGDKVPEYWGKPSPYTEGTTFLGTPPNHDELLHKRPLSPDVLELGSLQPHYKMPWGAVSSIMNRATGTALSVGFAVASYIALTGDLPGALAAFKANHPLLVVPTKLIITYPLVYHYLGGVRHFLWDLHKIGNQADRTSLLETPVVEQSSKVLLGSSVAVSLLLSIL
eukprot:GHRR01001814.1.p1 GENE.GHRR01001814.1~~GHRR01001814.1.p1  ORF type:complete len:206 (+),score=54.79 GHRR01001814.1:134-751(+)